jgi:hypothetical protein
VATASGAYAYTPGGAGEQDADLAQQSATASFNSKDFEKF